MQTNTKMSLLKILGFLWLFSMLISLAMIFLYAPPDERLGISQKIFYIHLGTASAMMLSVLTAFFGGVAYLITSKQKWDSLAAAGAETAVVFGTAVLGTGMIWAKTAWGSFLPMGEVKLVFFLVLWIIFFVYLILRAGIDSFRKKAVASAIFAIMAMAVMPFVVFATRWFDFGGQLHPNVIKADEAAMPAKMLTTLAVSIFSWLVGAAVLIAVAAILRRIKDEIRYLRS